MDVRRRARRRECLPAAAIASAMQGRAARGPPRRAPGPPCGAVPARQRRRTAVGSVCVPAARKSADWIGIDLDTVDKSELATPFGRFKVRRTLACIGILCKGRNVSLGKVHASIPEKDIVQRGNRPYIVIGRPNV